MTTPTCLRPFFEPGAVALLGASPQSGSLGHGIWRNLHLGPLGPRLVCINPRHERVGDMPCYARLQDVPGPVHLALVAAPLAQAATLLQECAQHKVRAAVLYGMADAQQTQALAHALAAPPGGGAGLRIWGPRALGYALPHRGLNVMPIHKAVPQGGLGFVSQSNSVCAAVLDWQHNNEFGFSAVFCTGQSIDVDLPELIDYLATDVHTESILLYLEGVRDARRFLSAVRSAASVKPVIVVKAGRELSAAQLARRHVGTAAADDAVFDAALRRCGALRVPSLGDMFSAARALGNARKPRGNRLAILCNGGGPGVMAADAAAQHQVALATLGGATQERLDAQLHGTWSRDNPVDVLFDTDVPRYTGALQAVLDDPDVDGVLSILTPNTFVDPLALAEATIETTQHSTKPVLSCWMGEVEVRPARARFARARMATFRSPQSAVIGFGFLVNWVRSQAQLQETPASVASYLAPDLARARALVEQALAEGRSVLEPQGVHDLLAAFHLHNAAQECSHPAAPCVQASITRDPVFGPVLRVHDPAQPDACAHALPPLNARLLAQMTLQRPLCQLLTPSTQRPEAATQSLQHVLLRLSEMASELPWLQALHIGCLDIGPEGARACRVRVELRQTGPCTPQYRHMAICPYPLQCVTQAALRDGSTVTLRPIRPEDANALQGFVRSLSKRSKYYRFFNAIQELPQKMLVRYTQIDYAREMTLVALTETDGAPVMVGEANYATLADGQTCEFAVVVADTMAGKGLGAALMRALMDAARAYGLRHIEGEVLANNEPMLALMESLGFTTQYTDEDTVLVSRPL
ncbi:MAG: bifunctional acetate--CoA ligase family protein/GNAT family N-acetyltransferase [Rhodoferax sp.]